MSKALVELKKRAVSAMSAREIICQTDEEVVVSIVMMLTGGAANPAVVRAQIKRIREEAKR